MSTIGGIGPSAAALTSLLSSPSSTANPQGAAPPDDLAATLQRDVDYAFKNGKSLDDIGRWLNQRVSAALRNHGVGDDQRQEILDQLHEIFVQGGSKADVRQSVDMYLQQVASDFSATGSSASSANAFAGPLGQTVDFTA
ncbi:MAG TPA: hypothetical protein VFW87_06940 [Pirellulales bacterium]|nr:hypothetical protein [Pirellulales bacterium]